MGNDDHRAAGPRPWMLSEQPWPAVRDTPVEVALLPWGATEAHNTHLPYGTDTLQAERMAEAAAGRAWARGARVVVLPAVPFGVNTTQLDIPLTLSVTPSTQLALLGDLVQALEGQGVRRLVILNAHGGNDFKPLLRELAPRTRMFLCAVNWWQVGDARATFTDPGDHAGELETSVMLHLVPRLVRPLDEAGDGHARRWRVAALREGWAWAPRRWTQVTADTGVGDPRHATAAKGAAYTEQVCARLADFLVELAATDPDALYE